MFIHEEYKHTKREDLQDSAVSTTPRLWALNMSFHNGAAHNELTISIHYK